jgi:predicted ArsR family transcriptional regulator
MTALRLVGYDPAPVNDHILLRNCPFRQAAQARPDVLCRMNHALVAGMVQGMQARSFDAVLDRAPGRCCVLVTSSTAQRGQRGGPASTAQPSRDQQPL